MFRQLLFILFILSGLVAGAQPVLKGIITDEKGSPVPKASVFLANTSVGTTANDSGLFSLTLPNGKYELIVSSIGFVTSNQPLNSAEAPAFLSIQLKVKAPELEAIIIEPYLSNGWERWGRFFLNNFIGESSLAADCKIINSQVIRFREAKKTGLLTATAFEPLVIENKALGYRIRYEMEGFSYSLQNRYVLFTGYPFFTEMTGSEKEEKAWRRARAEVYYGSLLHFMRSVFRNRIAEEGFDVRHVQRITNAEKERIKTTYGAKLQFIFTSDGRHEVKGHPNSDSNRYFAEVYSQPDYKEAVGPSPLTGDSIAYAVDSVTAGFEFAHYLRVIYGPGKARPEYIRQCPKNSKLIMSQLLLLNGRPVEIQANGMYYNPADILSLGYWAWSEKIATMLPFDYQPAQ